jgi:hypothetical protein
MAHANLVRSPLLLVFCEIAAILEEATIGGGARGSWMRLRNSGRDGHLLVGCLSFSHSARRLDTWGKWSCGLLLLSPAPICSRGVSEWGCRGYGGSEYGNLHQDSFCLGREGWLRNHLRWM